MTRATRAAYRLRVTTTADRARDFLEIRHGVDATDVGDREATRRAAAILGIRLDGEAATTRMLELRLDDSEREYERDDLGRFASSGSAAEHAGEHAELARAAAAGTSSASAKSRARQAQESAALARVAHEHGDHPAAARHAADAERHAMAAVRHGGASEWTVRERAAALREVDRARVSADPAHLAQAHHEAARAFGVTTSAGREHVREAAKHSSDARAASRGLRVGVSAIAGDDSPRPAPPAPEPPKEDSLDRMRRLRAERLAAGDQSRQVVFGQHDDFGRRAAENARVMARESVAKQRKEALDRQITTQYVTSKVVSLPPASVVRLPGLMSRIGSALRRSDELTDADVPTYDARVTSPLDRLRNFLGTRYGVDATRLDEAEVVRRASAILGPVESGSVAGRLIVLASRADADREYERDEAGRFASTGAASDAAREHAERGRAAAAGTTPSARASARKAEEHAALAKVAHEHGDLAGASHHAGEAQRHADAAVAKSGRGEKPTLAVPNKSMAEIVAERPRASTPTLSPEERARTAAVHKRMGQSNSSARAASQVAASLSNDATTASEHHEAAKAHDKAAQESRQIGDHVTARLHVDAAAAHVDAARLSRRVASGEGLSSPHVNRKADEYADRARSIAQRAVMGIPSSRPSSPTTPMQPGVDSVVPRRLQGDRGEIEAKARQFSKIARDSGKPEDHLEAAYQHERAARAIRSSGGKAEDAAEHDQRAATHRQASDASAASAARQAGSAQAQHPSDVSARRQEEEAARRRGDYDAARKHAEVRSSTAKSEETPQAHRSASTSHQAAAREARVIGDERSAKRHEGTADLHSRRATELEAQARRHESASKAEIKSTVSRLGRVAEENDARREAHQQSDVAHRLSREATRVALPDSGKMHDTAANAHLRAAGLMDKIGLTATADQHRSAASEHQRASASRSIPSE